jgi:hypothetical protein
MIYEDYLFNASEQVFCVTGCFEHLAEDEDALKKYRNLVAYYNCSYTRLMILIDMINFAPKESLAIYLNEENDLLNDYLNFYDFKENQSYLDCNKIYINAH